MLNLKPEPGAWAWCLSLEPESSLLMLLLMMAIMLFLEEIRTTVQGLWLGPPDSHCESCLC